MNDNFRAGAQALAAFAMRSLHRIPDALHAMSGLPFWRIVITFISGATTWWGCSLLYDVFGSDHGAGSIGWLKFAIPFGVAGSLHAAIYWALSHWVAAKRYKYLLIAFPLQLAAIAASFGTHWVHMEGGATTQANYRLQQLQTVQDLLGFVQSYQLLADETKSLAQHSDQQAGIEAASGTSCGVKVGDGQGPRYRLRMADKATFTALNAQIAARMDHVADLGRQAMALGASSADDAMAKVSILGGLVAQAKSYRQDVFLPALRDTAAKRLADGSHPFTDISRNGVPGTFLCPDSVMNRHLQAVLAAADALKPISDVGIQDARDPKVGYADALGRIIHSLFGARLAPPSREDLQQQRELQLHPTPGAPEGMQAGDVAPLVFASGIESLLTLLFLLGGSPLPVHPGLGRLEGFLRRRQTGSVVPVWQALGGSDAAALKATIAKFAKFENNGVLLLIPLHSTDASAESLLHLLEILTGTGLVRRCYTGKAFMKWFTRGWPNEKRAQSDAVPVSRVYRMRHHDYLSLIMDIAAAAKGESAPLGRPSNDDFQKDVG